MEFYYIKAKYSQKLTNDFDKKICNNLKVYTEDYAIYNGSLGWHNSAMAEHLLYNKPGLNDRAL